VRLLVRALLLLAGACAAASARAAEPAPTAPEVSGFRLENARVPVDRIVGGGPKRDEIRSVDQPKFTTLEEATWVLAHNPVIGVALGGEAHVYPLHLIERHQLVNDALGGVPVVVTYDPLAGATAAYERRVDGRTLELGVAGLLYNSNFLMYDRATESLFVQLTGEAVTGPLAGRRLRRIEARQETLGMWLERHPDSRVLARPDERIDYRYSPYTAYWITNRIPSRVDATDLRFHAKASVVGVRRSGKARAYLGPLVAEAGGVVDDLFEGRKIHVERMTDHDVFRWEIPSDVEVVECYWFVWKAFHPDTEVWHDPGEVGPLEE
jgi:hypothetical protein